MTTTARRTKPTSTAPRRRAPPMRDLAILHRLIRHWWPDRRFPPPHREAGDPAAAPGTERTTARGDDRFQHWQRLSDRGRSVSNHRLRLVRRLRRRPHRCRPWHLRRRGPEGSTRIYEQRRPRRRDDHRRLRRGAEASDHGRAWRSHRGARSPRDHRRHRELRSRNPERSRNADDR